MTRSTRRAAAITAALAVGLIPLSPRYAGAATTALTLSASISVPFGGSPFGTIGSDCNPAGAVMEYSQDSSYVTVALPGFGSSRIQTRGTLTSGALTGGPPLTVPTGSLVNVVQEPIEIHGTAGDATVTMTFSSGNVTCANYSSTDLSAGPYDVDYFTHYLHCDGSNMNGWDRRFSFSGRYEAIITPSGPDGAVIEKGRVGISAVHTSFTCPLGGSGGSAGMYFQFYPDSREPLDDVPPVVTGVPDRAANSAGWYNNNVTIDWQSTDPTPSSGTPTDPTDTLAATEGTNINYTSNPSCDPAGNCATGTLTLSIDHTPPTLTITGNTGTYRADQPLNIACNATDTLSGIATQSCPALPTYAGALPLGPHTYQADATDNAGNTTTTTFSFTVTRGLALTPDQCRNNGWTNVVDNLGNRFANQGDCISYLATNGRNKAKG